MDKELKADIIFTPIANIAIAIAIQIANIISAFNSLSIFSLLC